MSNDIVLNSLQQSPFDSIRHFDENGNEFWLARELMKMLGYAKWQRFEGVIEKATQSCKNTGFNIHEHFTHLPGEVSGKGRYGADFKLSRHACHLISMNGDPRKDAIAAAQSYFSVKAREAETQIPVLEQQTKLMELEIEKLRLEKEAANAQLALGQFRQYVVTALPEPAQQKILGYQEVVRVEEREVHITPEGDRSDGFGITAITKRYGFPSTKKAWEWLEAIGLGKDSPKWSSETRGVTSRVLPMDYISDLDSAWVEGDGRQRFLGE